MRIVRAIVGLATAFLLVLGAVACGDALDSTDAVDGSTTVDSESANTDSTTTESSATESSTTESSTTESSTTTTLVETDPPTSWAKYDLSTEPSSVVGCEMVYVPARGKVLLFGGRIGGGGDEPSYSAVLWEYDPTENTWASLGSDGPSGRVGHSMVYVPTIDKVILFGGNDSTYGYPTKDDLWSYDPYTDDWTELSPTGDKPASCTGQGMVFDPDTGKVFMFGGLDVSGAIRGFWAYDPVANTWSELSPDGVVPTARFGHAMVYDPNTRKILLFGGGEGEYSWGLGSPADGKVYGDLWAYDTLANKWKVLKPSRLTDRRCYSEMVYHPGSGLMIMFGGQGVAGAGYRTSLWAYDPVANNWMKLTPADRIPFGRALHCMAYEESSGKIIMFGGFDGNLAPLSGTWTLTP